MKSKKVLEQEVKDYLTNILLKCKKGKEMSAGSLTLLVKNKFELKTFNDTIVRKFINNMRKNGIPVLANSRGYFVSYDKEDILESYHSLINRSREIVSAADGLMAIVEMINLQNKVNKD